MSFMMFHNLTPLMISFHGLFDYSFVIDLALAVLSDLNHPCLRACLAKITSNNDSYHNWPLSLENGPL
jgi:hypothetical protein